MPKSAKPKPEPPRPPSGQLILGAENRNPLLSVCHDEDHAQFLIYYGFKIIEIVREHGEDERGESGTSETPVPPPALSTWQTIRVGTENADRTLNGPFPNQTKIEGFELDTRF